MSAPKSRYVERQLDADAVVPLTRKKNEADQIAQRIDERHDLGRQVPL